MPTIIADVSRYGEVTQKEVSQAEYDLMTIEAGKAEAEAAKAVDVAKDTADALRAYELAEKAVIAVRALGIKERTDAAYALLDRAESTRRRIAVEEAVARNERMYNMRKARAALDDLKSAAETFGDAFDLLSEEQREEARAAVEVLQGILSAA